MNGLIWNWPETKISIDVIRKRVPHPRLRYQKVNTKLTMEENLRPIYILSARSENNCVILTLTKPTGCIHRMEIKQNNTVVSASSYYKITKSSSSSVLVSTELLTTLFNK